MTFEVTILGSSSATPVYNRNPTAQLLNCNEKFYLIDCAEGTQQQLIKFGLKEAIQDYCDGINESHTITMKFTAIGQGELLEKSTEVILYRIVQELSNNALKHAEAKNIFIQFSQHSKGLSLVVEDDGVGFDTDQITKGAGLQNVQSRVDYLKGNWDIKSEIGSGTSVNIEIPL